MAHTTLEEKRKKTIFITGGCRSGKSRFALELANRHYQQKTFIATCQAGDPEMVERIRQHKEQRGPDWRTLEIPIALPDALVSPDSKGGVVLVDCLTLWVNNLLAEDLSEDETLKRVDVLVTAIKETTCSIIIVSNEVGTGIVPQNRLARVFRDIIGVTNQRLAVIADTVVWMVAGIGVPIKGVLELDELKTGP